MLASHLHAPFHASFSPSTPFATTNSNLITYSIASINVRGLRDPLKRSAIFNSLRSKYDIIFLQEIFGTPSDSDPWGREWEGKFIFNMFSTREAGVAILFRPNLDLEIKSTKFDDSGRLLQAHVVIEQTDLNLVNVYAPSGHTHIQERKEYFNSLRDYVSTDAAYFNIFAGDFNCVTNPLLDSSSHTNQSDSSVSELNRLINTHHLTDIYRLFHPDTKAFTFFSSQTSRRRLDRFYVDATKTNHVLKADIEPFALASDHNLVSLVINLGAITRGRGVWKFNTSLLTDDAFNTEVNTFWCDWKKSRTDFPTLLEWWETGKLKLRKIAISHSRRIAASRRRYKSKLEKQLRNTLKKLETRHSNGDLKRFTDLRLKLRNLEMIDARGRMIRSRAQWREEGERCSKFFANLEKSRGLHTLIRAIRREDGSITDNIYQILDEHTHFYKDLYTAETTDESQQDFILSHLERKLSDPARESCEGRITLAECTSAVKLFSNNKSPGTDGFPIEFYRHFWGLMGADFVDMANACYDLDTLSPSQRVALISTIFKKGDRLNIGNWRPISLCNLDYKIITKVLSLRVGHILEDIISPDQTCCVKGRNISTNLLLIRDLIAYANDENIPAIFLSIDQMKAFDRVDWSYLFKCLEAFGFGPSLIKWVRIIYTDISSCVKVNGHISEPFTLSRGVRQGCSLSALLYVLIAETFACLVRSDPNIKGIPLPGSSESSVISQYADDTTMTVSDERSVTRTFELLTLYESASGARINLNKCEGLLCGSLKQQLSVVTEPVIRWTNDKIKLLGLWVGNSDTTHSNWDNKVTRFCDTLKRWQHRDLSLKGKVCVINQLVASSLWYTASVLVMPPWVSALLEQALWQFFWGGAKFPVKKQICRLPTNLGGLGVIDLKTQSHALKTKWLQLLLADSPSKWRPLGFYFLGRYAGSNLGTRVLDLVYSPSHLRKLTPFYKELFVIWHTLNGTTRTDPSQWNIDQILETPIFNNPLILHPAHGRPLDFPKWKADRISRLKDITYEVIPGFLPAAAVHELFESSRQLASVAKELDTVCRALPYGWARRIQTAQPGLQGSSLERGVRDQLDMFIPLSLLKTKFVYSKLISRDVEPVLNWEGVPLHQFWKSLYECTLDNKIAALIWKIIHSGIFTACKLHKFKLATQAHCTTCQSGALETTRHIFWHCPVAKGLWRAVLCLLRRLGFTQDLSYDLAVTYLPQGTPRTTLTRYILDNALHTIWHFRNKIRFNEPNAPTDIIAFFIGNLKMYIQRDHELFNYYHKSTVVWAYQDLLCSRPPHIKIHNIDLLLK